MKNFKQLRQETLRERYIQKEVFQEGDYVMSVITGEKGRIHRSGTNYVIVITEDNKMFRAWIKDIRDVNILENINKERKKSIFFTNGQTETNDNSSSS
jgi:hypothetical protein